MPVPEFENFGNLPAGVHESNLVEVESRFAYNAKRVRLLDGFRDACRSLKQAGCSRVYLDGSFVSVKPEPGDFDACWEANNNVDPDLLEPELLDFRNGRKAQKARFGGELFLADEVADFDLSGKPILFVAFFQRDKITRAVKGIIAVDLNKEQL